MPTNTALLDYATTWPRWYRRTAVRRCLLIFLLAATLGGSWCAWKSTPGEWVRFAYWEHRCERYSAPPDKLVYASDDNVAAAKILGAGGIRSPDNPWDVFARCPEWMNLQQPSGGFPSEIGCTCFLHGRTTPNGTKRLVVAKVSRVARQALENAGHGVSAFGVWALVVGVLAPSRGSALPLDSGWSGSLLAIGGTQKPTLSLFAGQPDPSDSTHFAIGYIADGQPGTINVRLRDDDSAVTTVRDGPLVVISAADRKIQIFLDPDGKILSHANN